MQSRFFFSALLTAISLSSRAFATDEADELLAGRILVVKPDSLVKFLAKAPSDSPFALPDVSNDPTTQGASLQLFDAGEAGGSDLYLLPVQPAPLGWKGLGTPAGSKGYKYKGAGTAGDPCKSVLVTPKIVKAVCKGTGIDLTPPFDGSAAVVLTLGSASKSYCASFGGEEAKNTDKALVRKNAAAPLSCPAPAPDPGEETSIFVDTLTGNDAQPGSQAQPKKTIQSGITAAALSGGDVFVSKGTYNEQLTLADGVSVSGGYDAATAWSYATGNTVTVQSPSTTGFVASSIDQATLLQDLTVVSSDSLDDSGSTYGGFVTSSEGLSLLRVILRSGDAAAGDAGGNGSPGSNGGDGEDGAPGCENSSFTCSTCDIPAGGSGGSSACGRTGGTGGEPGLSAAGGVTGGTGEVGTPGGAGAAGESLNGEPGEPGSDGDPGDDGAGGSGITAAISGYLPADGSDGTNGEHANGGGGGGGGGGGTTDCDSYGSSGGGGGGGGCGGGKATGGDGGGGSFALYLYDSIVSVSQSELEAGAGGSGGAGGDGGAGGSGGAPGDGGPYGGSGEQDDGGFGNDGGPGGDAGRGGHGGGGAGGPSIGIFCGGSSTLAVNQSNTFQTAAASIGGSSLGNPGSAGTSSATQGCTP